MFRTHSPQRVEVILSRSDTRPLTFHPPLPSVAREYGRGSWDV